MISPDDGFKALSEIYTEFGKFCQKRGQVSEADTRAKIIDRILTEALGWPESAFNREAPIHDGYIDYVLASDVKNILVIEAKREGLPFEVPKALETRKRYKISGSIKTNPVLKEAIEQAQRYCTEVPVRYAVVTNGYSWLVFRALREDISWREGYVLVFPTAGYIKDHFIEFWNLLAYVSVTDGSLETAFAPEITTVARDLVRPIDLLRNPDAPLLRNRYHIQLNPFIESVFRDIGATEQMDTLKDCYVYNQSLRIVDADLKFVITDSIPRLVEAEGGVDTIPGQQDGGSFGKQMKHAVSGGKEAIFLLLGGIGSGKTTFLNRFFRFVEKEFIDQNAVWYYVNFIAPPPEDQIESFLYESVLKQLRRKYAHLNLETREALNEAYSDRLAYVQKTFLDAEQLAPEKAAQRINKYLEKWIGNLHEYVPRITRLARREGKTTVLVIDNVDQLPPSYQAAIFLLAQRAAKEMEAVVVVALREESYYAASIQKAFTAYNNRKFHIASPPFATLISRRLSYALNMLAMDPTEIIIRLRSDVQFDTTTVRKFLKIIEYSIFSKNRNISRFIESLAFGNMREALDMFATFLYSGATNVDKMLRIFDRDGLYFVPFHEFAKSVMLGDRCYYRDSESKITNLFDCGQDKNSSHFTAIRLLALLLSHINETSPEGRGFVRMDEVFGAFLDVFDNEQDLIKTINRLLRKQLVQVDSRSTESMKGSSYVRISSAGWYYYKYLVRAFAYLDLVFQDTPLTDEHLAANLKELIIEVDKISDIQEYLLDRMELRFKRVETFFSYLVKEEDREFSAFSLGQVSGILSQRFMPGIIGQYQKEREWIEERIRQKADKQPDDSFTLDESLPFFPSSVDGTPVT